MRRKRRKLLQKHNIMKRRREKRENHESGSTPMSLSSALQQPPQHSRGRQYVSALPAVASTTQPRRHVGGAGGEEGVILLGNEVIRQAAYRLRAVTTPLRRLWVWLRDVLSTLFSHHATLNAAEPTTWEVETLLVQRFLCTTQRGSSNSEG